MKRTKIPIKDIKPNEYNPNVIQKVEYEHLKTKIRNSGFLQEVLLYQKSDGKYVIIDGEHRMRAVKELGGTEIDARIINKQEVRLIAKKFGFWKPNMNMLNALKIITMNMNRGRGTEDYTKFAELIESLKQDIAVPEIRDILNLEKKETEDLLKLVESEDIEIIGNGNTDSQSYHIPTSDSILIVSFGNFIGSVNREKVLRLVEKLKEESKKSGNNEDKICDKIVNYLLDRWFDEN